MRAVRWGDNDRYWGPFTYSPPGSYAPWAIILESAGDSDHWPVCTLRISGFSRTFIVALPPIVRPWRQKVVAHWDAETISRLGRDWYWDVKPREFGFSYTDGFLQIKYGRSTHDSSTDRSKGYFLPWTQWRHVRRSLYDLEGKHFWTEIDAETHAIGELGTTQWRERYDIVRKWEEICPNAPFMFKDFDGELLTATTKIEEREWRFGTGWCKWLSWFRRPRIQRSLDIAFSGETGRRKGSWKGGTIGHSIQMLPGELHRGAFQRYCTEHEMTFLP